MTEQRRTSPKRIVGNPWEKQTWEQPKQYECFQYWLHHDKKLGWADVALEFNIKPESVARYARMCLWEVRYQRTKGLQSIPEHITLPQGELDPVKALEGGGDDKLDPALARLLSQEELLTEDFYTATKLYKTLLRTVEMAVANLSPDDLTTASELKSICSVLTDLQQLRSSMSEKITGVQKLAKAIREHRTRRK